MPVREALHLLKQEGLVTFRPNRGAIVSHLSYAEVDEMYTMRIALETSIFARAIPNYTAEDLARMRRILEELDDVLSLDRWADMNWEFHHALYEPAGLNRMLRTIDSLHANIGRYLHETPIGNKAYLERSQAMHWELFELCQAGLVDDAVALMKIHLAQPQEDLKRMMEAEEI